MSGKATGQHPRPHELRHVCSRPSDPTSAKRALLLLSLPIVASMASRTAMQWVDFVMVSSLGPAAQAALVPAGVMLFCVIAFGLGLASVVAALTSQTLGRGDAKRCGQWAWQGLWVSAAWGAVALALLPLVSPAIVAMGHAPEVAHLEIDYVTIGLWGVGPTVAAAGLTAFFQGIHRPWAGLWATLASNAVNVAGNYALIFGHWGFPAMGVKGAAWATVIASGVALLVLLAFLRSPRVWRGYGLRHGITPRRAQFMRIARLGAPAGLQATADLVAFTLFLTLLVGQYGVHAMAGSNVAFKYFELAIIPVVGLGMATTAAIGRAVGANDQALGRDLTRWAWRSAVAWTGLISLAYIATGPTLVSWLTEDVEVRAQAADVLYILALLQLFDAGKYVLGGALRGHNDTAWPAVVLLACFISIMLGGGVLAVTVAPQLGVRGPWWAATAAYGATTLLFAWRLRQIGSRGARQGVA